MPQTFIPILVLLAIAAVMATVILTINALVSPKLRTRQKLSTYESGVPLVDAQRQISRVCDSPTMIREAYLIAQRFGLRVPITSFLYSWMSGRVDLRSGLEHLLEDEAYVE